MKRFALVLSFVLLAALVCVSGALAEDSCDHWRYCGEMICAVCEDAYAGSNIVHPHDPTLYEADSKEHWHVCEECGGKVSAEEHVRSCDGDECLVCTVGYTGSKVVHLYSEDDYKYDADGHWYICENCDNEVNAAPHSRNCNETVCRDCGMAYEGDSIHHETGEEYTTDATSHWYACANCDERLQEEQHQRNCDEQVCNICDADYTGENALHDSENSVFAYDGDYHWYQCEACGGAYEQESHWRRCDETVCGQCGVAYIGEDFYHDYQTDTIQKDANYHWYACADCGDPLSKTPHMRNCDEDTCYICNEPYTGNRISHYYDEDSLKYNEQKHWYVCSECGDVYDDGYHSRQCTESTCMTCDAEYTGDYLYHNCDWSDYKTDAANHWIVCEDCGTVVDKAPHVRACNGDECIECGAPFTGTAVEHSYMSNEYQGDQKSHWLACADCGESFDKQPHWRSCGEEVCGGCGLPYTGDHIDHSYSWSVYETNNVNHWHVCEDCGEVVGLQEHIRNCGEDVCAVCYADCTGGEIVHDFGYSDYKQDETHHWSVCYDCGVIVEKTAHTRNCDGENCLTCGAEYTGNNVRHIAHWNDWHTSDTQHWHVCSTCGDQMDTDQHYSACDAPGTCVECGAAYNGGNHEHNYTADPAQYTENTHTLVCNDCGASVSEQHMRICSENICLFCDAMYDGTNVTHNAGNDWHTDATHHWQVCEDCGSFVHKSTHYNDCTDLTVCDVCGVEHTGYLDNHQFDFDNAVTDEEYCYVVCINCGREEAFLHSRSCDGGEVCVNCGAPYTGDEISHNVNYDDWKISDTHHWHICFSCDEIVDLNEHVRYCDDDVCLGCGVAYLGDNILHHGIDYDAPLSDELYHWYECQACGEEKALLEEHFDCGDELCFCGASAAFAIVEQPVDTWALYGKSLEVTIKAVGEDVTYTWYVKPVGENAFKLSTISGPVYSVVMHQSRNGSQIYCVVEDAYGRKLQSNTATIAAVEAKDAMTITKQPVAATVAEGETAKTTVTATGIDLTYAWYAKLVGEDEFTLTEQTGATYQQVMDDATHGMEVYCEVSDITGAKLKSDTVILAMQRGLVITQQPENAHVADGKEAVVTVKAVGDGLKYQWYVKTRTDTRFNKSSISGSVYSVVMNTTRSGNKIYCVVTDKYGNTVTSDTVTISIMAPLTITKQPASVSVEEGKEAKVKVEATGDELTYAWYVKAPGAASFTLSDVTEASYSATMNDSINGTQLYCAVTDVHNNTVNSNTVMLTKKGALVILKQPASVSVEDGKNATATVEASGDGLTYAWYVRAAGDTTFRLSNITSKTCTVAMTAEKSGTQAYCIVTDQYGQRVQTDTVTFSANQPELLITQQPESTYVKENTELFVTIKAEGTGLSYAWYVKKVGSDSFIKSSNTTSTYSTTMLKERDGNLLYCVVTDSLGRKLQSETVEIGIAPPDLFIIAQPESVTVEKGEMATVTIAAIGDELTYTWYVRNAGDDAFGKSTISGSVYSVEMTPERSGNQLYCVVTDSEGNAVTSETVSINMLTSALEIIRQPESVEVKYNEKATVSVEVVGEGVSYKWFVKNANSDTYGVSTITGPIYSVDMTPERDGNQIYCVVTDKNGNGITSDMATISMNRTELAITKQPVSVEVGLNESATLKVEAQGDGLSYAWYVKTEKDGSFVKSSISSSTYSVLMTDSKDGNEVYCIVTDVYGDSIKSDVVTTTKTPIELVITKQPVSVCVEKGEVATVKVEAKGDGLTYAWYQMGPGESIYSKTNNTTNTYSLSMHEARNGSRVYCVVTDKRGISVKSNTVVLSMETPVIILVQPASVTVDKDKTATVSVVATGEKLSYTWYVKTVGTDAFKLSNITGDTYSVVMNAERDGNQLYCVVTDSNGYSVTSDTVTLSMTKSVAITQQPASVTVRKGETATVSVEATGEGLTYTWFVKKIGTNQFIQSTITTSDYAVVMTDERNGNQLYCVVTDATGASVQSETVTISMLPNVIITKQPVSVDADLGAMATIKVEAVGENLTYTWYVKRAGTDTFIQSSITGDTYSVPMTEARDGNQIYCIVSDNTGSSVKTDTVTIKLIPPVVITTQPVSVFVEKGQNAVVMVEATGDGITYAWYVKQVGSTSFIKSSITGKTYSVNMNDARNGNQLYCVVTDRNGYVVKSDTVTIGVKTALAINKQPVSVTVPKDDQAIVTVEATGNDLTYAWYVKAVGSEAFVKSDVTTREYAVTMTAEHNGEELYCVVTDGDGATVTSNTVTISMKPEIVITQQPVSVVVADGAQVKIPVKATGANLSYTWYVKISGTDSFIKSSITGDTYSVTMTPGRNGNQLYCIITDSNGSTVKSDTVTISLLSSAVITKHPESVTVFNGTAATATVEAVGEGLTYTWYLKEVGSATFSQTNVTSNTYSVTMNAANNGIQVYCIVKDSKGNSLRSNTATLSMKESGLAITKQPVSTQVALDEMAIVTVEATGEGLTYTWYVRQVGSDTFIKSSIAGDVYSVPMTDARDGNQLYCVVADTYGNTVRSNTVTISMKKLALAITKQPTSVSAIPGTQATFTVEAEGAGLTYAWYTKADKAPTYTKTNVTSNTYTVTMTAEMDKTQLFCEVTDKYGNSIESDVVSLLIQKGDLAITKHPASVGVKSGTYASVTVEAVGDGLTYTWYVKQVGSSSFIKSSISGPLYSVVMNDARNGNQVYCVVADRYGNSIKSNTATISIKRDLQITAQPQSVTVPAGDTATVSVTAVGDGLTYAWYAKEAGATSFTLTEVTAPSFSIAVDDSMSGMQLYCVVTDAYDATVRSNTVTLATKKPLAIVTQPVSTAVELDAMVTVTTEAVGEGLTYTWYIKPVGGSSFSKSSISGKTYSVQMTTARDGNQIYCVVTDAHGGKVQSDTVTISMLKPALKITEQPASTEVKMKARAILTLKAEGVSLRYEWYLKAPNASKFTKQSATTSNFSVVMSAAYNGSEVYCIVTDKFGQQLQSDTVTLTAEPSNLAIVTQPVTVMVAKGKNAVVSVEAVGDGLTYTWYVKKVGASDFIKSSITTKTYSVTMDESRDGNQVYCVVKDEHGFTVTSSTAVIAMKPPELVITKQPVSAQAVVNNNVSVSVQAEGDGLAYAWYAKLPSDADFTKTNVTKNTYSITMTEERDGMQVYCVVSDKHGQEQQSATVILSMKAMPKLEIVSQPQSVTVEEGKTAAVSVQATGDGLTYTWYVKKASDNSVVTSKFTSNTYSVEMTKERSGNQVYCVVSDCYGNKVTSDTATISMYVEPEPEPTPLEITSQPRNVCVPAGSSATVSVSANGDGLRYIWYVMPIDSGSFKKSSIEGRVYSVEMNANRNGNMVYCVVQDQYGNEVTSNTVTISME